MLKIQDKTNNPHRVAAHVITIYTLISSEESGPDILSKKAADRPPGIWLIQEQRDETHY